MFSTRHFLSVVLLSSCLLGSLTSTSAAADLRDALRTVRAVGAEGQGNKEAAVAWKTLIQADPQQLPELLSAMTGANDYAQPWLRSAVDTVAQKAADQGNLPVARLGQFLFDLRQDPGARRLAFEWISRRDTNAAERLLPGFLNDPSLELRRDAVQRLIDATVEKKPASGAPSAESTLLAQQALTFARDVEQIGVLTKFLKAAGQEVDVPKLFGFLQHWKVVGPFDNTDRKGFETVFAPENKIDLQAEYDGKSGKVRWQDYISKDDYGKVDVNQVCGKLKSVTAYAYTEFTADKAQAVELRLGGKNSWKVWLNGQLLFGRDEYHRNAEIDQYRMPATLQPGKNTILVKVCQNEQTEDWTVEWEFQLRVCDALGTAIHSTAPPAFESTAQR